MHCVHGTAHGDGGGTAVYITVTREEMLLEYHQNRSKQFPTPSCVSSELRLGQLRVKELHSKY